MELIFIAQRVGLEVNFRNLSTKVPTGTTFQWDFGDSSEKVTDKNPTHIYTELGFYEVTLTAVTPTPDPEPTPEELPEIPLLLNETNQPLKTITTTILVSNRSTSLSGSIYNLIDQYIPSEVVKVMTFEQKRAYIEKWQLYIQPLVNREVMDEIPISKFNDELEYEALENQLVMEAAAVDYLTVSLTNLLQSKSSQLINESTSSGTPDTENPHNNGKVKKIITGPTEVEFFDTGDTEKNVVSNVTKALQPGGILDTLKKNLCTLSFRLEIHLPFCNSWRNTTVPEVVNRRNPKGYQGPNPTTGLY